MLTYPHWAFTASEWDRITGGFWLAVDWVYLIVTGPALLVVRWVMVSGRHRA